ncbi:DUF5958 family protein [Streptomyces sp. NPDC047980]|uniref:DUF5958 family protein n=1 Tax=unclassified Streptomyces TaxID=2593676 RepID=UPI0037104F16
MRYGTNPDVYLNELAQGLRPLDEGIEWFAALPEDEQTRTLRLLAGFCFQAHPTAEEAVESIRRSGLRPTHTPAVMLVRGRIEDRVGAIASLTPRHERMKAFRLLIALLAIADGRRRRRCRVVGCGHEWHRLTADREAGTGRPSGGAGLGARGGAERDGRSDDTGVASAGADGARRSGS